MIIYFFTGLAFWGLGLAAYLQQRQGSDLPLNKHLKWLAAFGFVCGVTSWIDMFLTSGGTVEYLRILTILRMITQPLSGLLLLRFGWGILRDIPLPAWAIFIPGILIVPISYVITYAATSFITPSPIEIPIEIWSRYLLYLPGSIMTGIGFMRQWDMQRKQGLKDVANLMLGAGAAFLFEAFVVGLVVPAAPYGPASYYNYNRNIMNAFTGEQAGLSTSYGLTGWLDYAKILAVTGLPISFWRMVSALTVTFFVVRGLGVFESNRKRQFIALQKERDLAQEKVMEAQISARKTAESWTEVLVNINRRIIEFEDVDGILLFTIESTRRLLRSDFVGLALLSQDSTRLELKCSASQQKVEVIASPIIIENPLILQTMKSAGTYRSSSNESQANLKNIWSGHDQSVRSVAIVGLALDNHPIGALWIARAEAEPYSETELVWLDCMADQVVIAIQHGLMTSRLQSLSITEERARIARDMHDGLAQVLGYLNLQVQTLDALLKQGKQKALKTELDQMREAVRIANADVREDILILRTTLADEKDPVSAIGEYLQEFSIQTGIETDFDNEVVDDLNISSIAEVQLVCILREALANVRKHAHASLVKVSLMKKPQNDGNYVYLQIVDDGDGFVPRDSSRSFGIKTMKERATSAHGTFEVHSILGSGTTIECRFPIIETGKLKKSPTIFFREDKLSIP
jgi:signal transduction histidine kinase